MKGNDRVNPAVFLSIVGGQTMAVLNPLLSLLSQGMSFGRIILLVTRFSKPRAERIKAYLVEDKGIAEEDISVVMVSNSLIPDRSGNEPAHMVTGRIAEESELYFNLAGGLNFQIAACVAGMNAERCVLLLPVMEGVNTYYTRCGMLERYEMLPLPDAVKVLSLQGIPYEIHAGKPSDLMEDAFVESGLQRPRISGRVLIGDVFFEHVWNTGNTLRFLKVISGKEYMNKGRLQSRRLRKDLEALIVFANSRDALGDLNHRTIAVLTDIPQAHSRIAEQGAGKVKSILREPSDPGCRKDLQDFVLSSPHQIPSASQTGTGDHAGGGFSPPAGKGKYAVQVSEKTLIVPLGQDILPTMIAVWSHSPGQVIFLYTPGNARVERIKKAIQDSRNLLPAENIAFIPTGIDGREILNLDLQGGRPEMNITPGTKGQGAFMAVLARRISPPARLFSLRTQTQNLEELLTGKTRPLRGPDPQTLLRLSGADIRIDKDTEAIMANRDLYEAMLRFLTQLDVKTKILDLLHTGGRFKGGAIVRHPDDRMELTFDGKDEVHTWDASSGAWFEELTAYCFISAGADDVCIGLEMRDPAPRREILSEFDVAARFKSDYYIVSCKATSIYNPGYVAKEAEFYARLLGRFAIPVVAFLGHRGKPDVFDGVYTCGKQTFTDPKTLSVFLQAAKESRSRFKNRENVR